MTQSSGETALLESIMGAKGHMVAFDYSSKGIAHMHPTSKTINADPNDGLHFLFNVPTAGQYRLWAQVQVNGTEFFAPFDVLVQ